MNVKSKCLYADIVAVDVFLFLFLLVLLRYLLDHILSTIFYSVSAYSNIIRELTTICSMKIAIQNTILINNSIVQSEIIQSGKHLWKHNILLHLNLSTLYWCFLVWNFHFFFLSLASRWYSIFIRKSGSKLLFFPFDAMLIRVFKILYMFFLAVRWKAQIIPPKKGKTSRELTLWTQKKECCLHTLFIVKHFRIEN